MSSPAPPYAPNWRRGIALSLGSAAFAAVFLVSYKAASRAAPTHAVVLAMLAGALVFNLATALWQSRGRVRLDRVTLATAAALALLTITGNYGMSRALSLLDAGVTSALVQSQLLIVAALSWIFLGDRVSARYGIGAAIALGGFVIMRIPLGDSPPIDMAGVGWAMVPSASFGSMLVITRGVVHRVDLVGVNAMRLVLAVVALALVPGHAADALALEPAQWAQVLLAAAAGPFVSRLMLMFALRSISASHSKLVTLTAPVFAFALGFLVFGTIPSAREALGSALIIAGVVLPVLELARDAARPK